MTGVVLLEKDIFNQLAQTHKDRAGTDMHTHTHTMTHRNLAPLMPQFHGKDRRRPGGKKEKATLLSSFPSAPATRSMSLSFAFSSLMSFFSLVAVEFRQRVLSLLLLYVLYTMYYRLW